VKDRAARGLRQLLRYPVIVGLASGITFVGSYVILRDIGGAAAWGLAVGMFVAGADPRWFLSLAVVLLLAPPVFLLFGANAAAEVAARLAFFALAIGVALEFREDFVERARQRRSSTLRTS
jgi:hypothetical protein